jgi:hypothetical protein
MLIASRPGDGSDRQRQSATSTTLFSDELISMTTNYSDFISSSSSAAARETCHGILRRPSEILLHSIGFHARIGG